METERKRKDYTRILIYFDEFIRKVDTYTPPTKSRSQSDNPNTYTEEDKITDKETLKTFLNGEGKDIANALKETNTLFNDKMFVFLDRLITLAAEKLKFNKYGNGILQAALAAYKNGEITKDYIENRKKEMKISTGGNDLPIIPSPEQPPKLSEPGGSYDSASDSEGKIPWYQIIYFGAPGTGKSTKAKELTGEEKMSQEEQEERIFRTTFHPDYDYSTFVGAYKPCPGDITKSEPPITYRFEPQIFMKAYLAAWKSYYSEKKEMVWLIIEEINRGNCAQIFGDIFQLLDRESDGFSKYPIKCNSDIANYLQVNDVYQELSKNESFPRNGTLRFPPTLSLIATMNTSDQSLFPMDSAFKRRWQWEYIRINTDEKDERGNDNKAASFTITLECTDGPHKYRWVDFIKEVNKQILKLTSSEDKQLGTYFISDSVGMDEFTGKVIFYLWNDVCKDEYGGNSANFMQSKCEPSVRNNTKEFTFSDLYSGDEKRRGDILKGFMEYLEIKEMDKGE